MRRKKIINFFRFFSIPAVVLHIVSLFIVPPGTSGFWGIFFSVFLLLALNIYSLRFEIRLIRRLSRETDLLSWKAQSENAVVIMEKNVEQERKIYKTYHDIYNHMSVISAILNENDARGAAEYINKLILQIKDRS